MVPVELYEIRGPVPSLSTFDVAQCVQNPNLLNSPYPFPRKSNPTDDHMKALFEPNSIAVVGASAEERKIGHIMFRNLIASGFKGELYLVRKDGTSFPAEISSAIFMDRDGNLRGGFRRNVEPDRRPQAGHPGFLESVACGLGLEELCFSSAADESRVAVVPREHSSYALEVEEMPAGQKAYVGLLRRGGLRLADRKSFQDFDVLQAELTRLFAVDAETLQSDRS